jgi:hypothetical protein
MNPCLLTSILLLLSFVPDSFAEDHPWQLRKKEDGIAVYTRKVDNSSILEFKGMATINAPIDQVAALFEEDETVPKWFYHGIYAQPIETISDQKKTYYFNVDLPWPIHDRDTAFERIKSRDIQSGEVSYTITAVPKRVPLRRGVVRVLHLKTLWRFVPLADGGTEVHFQQHSNPRGFFAPVVTNQLAVDIPFYSLKNLRELAEQRLLKVTAHEK